MKVLLMTPFMSYRDRWGQYYKGAGDTFPQGIGSIAGYLEAHGWDVDVLEPDIAGFTLQDFENMLREGNYTLIGLSIFTTTAAFGFQTAETIKRVCPDAFVAAGGAHPTLFPHKTLEECPHIDFIVSHEGEKPMLALVEALAEGRDTRNIPNLHFREADGGIHHGEGTPDWLDLDELPLFPYHKFDMELYVPAPSLRRVLPTFNYMAQRGCPFNCAFCDTRTHGRKVRYRSVSKVMEDLHTLKRRYALRGLIFEGSNFTADPRWIRGLCERMIDERLDLSWYCMGRVDLEPGLLPLMRQAGLWCMSFGIESANPHTLKRMRKGISPETVRATVGEAQRLGIRTVGSFILGYPGEDKRDVRNTISYASALDLDVAVFFIPVPFPGTKLHEDALATGGLRQDLTWKDYQAWLDHNNPIYINPLLGEDHVALYNEAFRRFYLRPGYIWKQLRGIRSVQDVLRLCKGFLSVEGLIRKNFLHGRMPRDAQ